MNKVYVALGSNLADPQAQLVAALRAMNQLPDSRLISVSSFYQSKPLGPQDQPDYVNAVACLETALSPFALLDELQRIEQEQGRVRLRRWGERTLDLDILLYAEQTIQSERLIVPHYDMHNREFVIIPLAEIAPSFSLPNGQSIRELMQNFTHHQMVIVKEKGEVVF
ncbi:2-amino-4-hydroxy-6-hydroxymethyldihydropteridine diphosphokinase [Aggregatibacter actinomycetemcomitans]|uniref:2-amino-4-hydroxy-6- hydroxymethyldihydropteridine diphosphokinase n=1 Tax=Aggregatibacter actinomycetemcomitans TaxID=714 RepID=UPI00022AC254|nr:2-amino-4-hydroxy-6-hydroxymethyldihydropteridine diphosphokinase [Aggregatibacter actinomycetemcomitans]KOE68987.1 7,8-dihydro-6-hydroxymethylpterin-pyrophosphokinase [Aggregatibacter actinomycetemcomitans serotype f str. D18P1]KYK87805.1 2-amino-4-hydroxy-6-hydroxymethyldihydropteridine pyrophosphokinase [Aggregatibacter actinomycetemcomitans serotype f str. SC29R]MBN6062618.1 2-amino-4-hydroxy-6-hydroxymethyldihydropteridine diphosphokinase [Aggregatibacter actinomycetemcomitans]OZV18292.